MVNLADLDTEFLVPCKRCAELLPEGERFCRYCGQKQFDSLEMGEQGWELASVRGVIDRSTVGMLAPFSNEPAPRHWTRSFVGGYRLAIGVLAALFALLAFALLHDIVAEKRGDAMAQGAQAPASQESHPAAKVSEPAAEQAQAGVVEDAAPKTEVLAPQDAVPVQASVPQPAAPPEPPPSAEVTEPRKALALTPSAAPQPPAEAAPQLSTPATPPTATASAPEPAAPAPKNTNCDAALAAMALCAKP